MNENELSYLIETLAQELDVRTPSKSSSHELNRCLVREFIDLHPQQVADAVAKATMSNGKLTPFVLTQQLISKLESHARMRVLPG